MTLRNRTVPPLLQTLTSRRELSQAWAAIDLELDLNASKMMDDLPSPTVAEVVPFAYDKAHRYFGFWTKADDLATAPIVFVDNEGGVSSCLLAANLSDFLSMSLIAGPHLPSYVDTLFNTLESPERAAMMPPYIGWDLKDVLTAAGSEAAAWSKLVEHVRTQCAVPANLVAAMAELGVVRASESSVLERVRAARKAHPRFQLAARD